MVSMQKLLAELFGTFTLVFVGSLAIISAGETGGVLLVSISLGFGLALLIGLYAFGEVSGGHFNPVVTLAMYLDKRLPTNELIGYWVAQFAGAVLASLLVLVAFDSNRVESTVTAVNPVYGTGAALIVEIVLTAAFLAVILQASRSDKMSRTAFTAIPLALVAIHVAAIPISGASVNPARSFGPALVGTDFTDLWLYFVAPAAGAVIGWAVHSVVVIGNTNLRGGPETPPTPAA